MGTVNIDNYHQEYIQRQQDMYSFLGMYSVFTVFYLILVFIVLYQMLEEEEYEANRSLEIFRALGMEEEFIRKKKKIEIGVMGILAVLGSGIVAFGALLLSCSELFGLWVVKGASPVSFSRGDLCLLNYRNRSFVKTNRTRAGTEYSKIIITIFSSSILVRNFICIENFHFFFQFFIDNR